MIFCSDYLGFRMRLVASVDLALVNYMKEYGPYFVPTEEQDQEIVARRLFLCAPRIPPKTASGKLYLQG